MSDSTLFNKDLMILDSTTYKITSALRHEINLAFVDSIWSKAPNFMIYDMNAKEEGVENDNQNNFNLNNDDDLNKKDFDKNKDNNKENNKDEKDNDLKNKDDDKDNEKDGKEKNIIDQNIENNNQQEFKIDAKENWSGNISISATKRIYDIMEQSEYLELFPEIENNLSQTGKWGLTIDLWNNDIYISEGRVTKFPSKLFKRKVTNIGILKESIVIAGATIFFYEEYSTGNVQRTFTISEQNTSGEAPEIGNLNPQEASKKIDDIAKKEKTKDKSFVNPMDTIALFRLDAEIDYGDIDFTPAFEMRNLVNGFTDMMGLEYRIQSIEETWDAFMYELKYNRTKFIFIRDNLEFETDFGIKQLDAEETAMLQNAAFALTTMNNFKENSSFPWEVIKADAKLMDYWNLLISQINELYKIVGVASSSIAGGSNKTTVEVASNQGRTFGRIRQKILQRQKDLKKLIEYIILIDIGKMGNKDLYPENYYVKVTIDPLTTDTNKEQAEYVKMRLDMKTYDLIRAIMALDGVNPLEAKLEADRIAKSNKFYEDQGLFVQGESTLKKFEMDDQDGDDNDDRDENSKSKNKSNANKKISDPESSSKGFKNK